MIQTCSCGNIADYAVYDDARPLCLLCMLKAVEVPLGVKVRTLDPWEKELPDTKNAPGCNQGRS
ncbi:hypothetical protein [Paenibacillus donghaensis]|uniref:Uncharacterized protein n=1 Tax=Paenibacillus donghaensis TaxID=414771 RepID=A0A2Z2KSC7_9BACL|nr:hypothetical protein [Paenibacillus donghaensis]ASA22038.1 hypothetical protein B9T62_15400 [Paenibacillus donghaensis]